MKEIKKKIIYITLSFWPVTTFAQNLQSAEKKLNLVQSRLNLKTDIFHLTNIIFTVIFSLVGTVFFGLIIYGGFVWIKAAGRKQEIDRAKKIVSTSTIGLVIILASYAITNFIFKQLGG